MDPWRSRKLWKDLEGGHCRHRWGAVCTLHKHRRDGGATWCVGRTLRQTFRSRKVIPFTPIPGLRHQGGGRKRKGLLSWSDEKLLQGQFFCSETIMAKEMSHPRKCKFFIRGKPAARPDEVIFTVNVHKTQMFHPRG